MEYLLGERTQQVLIVSRLGILQNSNRLGLFSPLLALLANIINI